MQGNDIATWAPIGQAAVFEGLLASPPSGGLSAVRNWIARRNEDWDSALVHWRPNEIALKSMIDMVNRRQITTGVYTFLAADACDAIERWLLRKGVVTLCTYYTSVESLAEDLIYDRSIHVVYTPSAEMARTLGIRATAVTPSTVWTL